MTIARMATLLDAQGRRCHAGWVVQLARTTGASCRPSARCRLASLAGSASAWDG
ncbi:hypothetical protein [Xanthomonas axonopodis]|uniref:hypothetical protein n=1 Tax=Xanthomonas axonopodis TaxID=53413 RepID=UPI000B2FD584|nr:hypothetical protein [Xanthomonas axonopodis]